MKTLFRHFALMFIALSFIHCATSYQSNLDEARFELDKGNYTAAINAATSALAANPGNIAAARILASAYSGRSGIDFLALAEGMLDLQDSSEPNFQVIAGYLPATATLSDLRTAITTLEALDGIDEEEITSDDLQDAAFDLGMMQMVEHFARGVYGSGFFGTLDVSGITDDDATIVQNDLLLADGRVIASGVDPSEQFIGEVRQTFCVLEPLSAGEGFTTSEYRALVACQLSEDPDSLDTTAIDAGVANCSAVDPTTAAVETCSAQDTSL